LEIKVLNIIDARCNREGQYGILYIHIQFFFTAVVMKLQVFLGNIGC